jgi:glycine/D-amino acid oxidase-like deaminating enzyme
MVEGALAGMGGAWSTEAVWEVAADRGQLAQLDPGVPGELDPRPDVLVVGGGVVGLATAALCRRAGLGRVSLVERGRLAAGPSGRAGGILAPGPHHWTDPPALVDFGRASLALWRRLDREWAGELGVEPLDVLHALPAGTAPPAAPPGARLLAPEDARELEPSLPPGTGGLLLPHQARVGPLRLAAALARRAAAVATGVEVLALERAASGRVRVRTSHGDLLPGAVVLATGMAPSLAGVPRAPDGQLVKGLLIATEPAPFRLRVGVHGRDGLAFQLHDGRLVFGNTFDPRDPSPRVRPEAAAATLTDLCAVLPRAAGLAVAHAWSCFRPATGDRLPVIDRLDGLGDVWVTYGHFRTGVLIAAATGEALASWIASGTRPAAVAPFGLTRAAGGAGSAAASRAGTGPPR